MFCQAELALLLLCSLLLQIVIAAPAIEDCFRVDFSTDDEGGSQSYEQTLRNLWTDTQALANAGAALAYNYGSDPVATRIINGYFLQATPPDADEIDSIKRAFDEVNNFVSNPYTGNNKPYIFTGDGWLQAVQPTDQLKDINGNGVSNAQGPVQAQADSNLAFTGSVRSWFSLKHNRYLLDANWGIDNNGNPRRYCSVPSHLAVTQDELDPPSITFCIRSFTQYGGKRLDASVVNTQNLPAIGSQTPRGLKLQPLPSILIEAMTMYHELFHLLGGTANTPPAPSGEEYNLQNILRLRNRAKIISNPETFAFAALAYYYALNTSPVVDFSVGGLGMRAM